jgi:hypothetical protein
MQNMYKQTKNGEMITTSGALGKGIYLTSKIANPDETMKISKHVIDTSKLATMEDINRIAGRTVDIKEIKNMPDLRQALINKGMLGIKIADKAMLFPETQVNASKSFHGITDSVETPTMDEIKSRIKNTPKYTESVVPTTTTQLKEAQNNQEIKDLVSNLNAKKIGMQEAMQKAQDLGFNLSRRGKDPKTGMGGTWIYNKKGK